MKLLYPIVTFIPIKTTVHHVWVNGFSIEYVKAGHGPPLILLHGANIGWIQWYNVIAPLAESHTVYAFDWPGSGNSTPVDYLTLDIHRHFVRTLTEFVKTLRMKRLSIIAHSVSGVAAVYWANEHPAQLRKLVLVDSMGFTDYLPPSNYPVAFGFMTRLLAATVMKPTLTSMRSFLESVLVKSVYLPDEFVDHFYRSVIRSVGGHPIYFMHALTDGFRIKKNLVTVQFLPKLAKSILVLHGERDPLIPAKKISAVMQQFPLIKFYEIAGAGHVPSLESPEEFLLQVKAFLD